MSTDKVKFKHLRSFRPDGTVNNLGGVTIAYKVVSDKDIVFALAFCHPKDNFNKRVGRIKASGRLNSPKYSTNILSTEKEFHKKYIPDVLQVNTKYLAVPQK